MNMQIKIPRGVLNSKELKLSDGKIIGEVINVADDIDPAYSIAEVNITDPETLTAIKSGKISFGYNNEQYQVPKASPIKVQGSFRPAVWNKDIVPTTCIMTTARNINPPQYEAAIISFNKGNAILAATK